MPRQRIQGRLIAWPLVALLAAYYLFWGGTFPATYYAEFRVWALIPAFAVVAIWVVVAVRSPAWRPHTALSAAFLGAAAAFLICSATSRYPRLSVEYLALAILLAALYLILQRLMASDFFRPRMVGVAAVATLVVALAYVAVVAARWITWWGLVGRFTAPPLRPFFEGLALGNPGAVLTATVLLSAPAVAHLAGGGRAARVGAIAMAAVVAVAAILSGSRAGWLAIGVAIVGTGGLWLAAPDRRATLLALSRSRTARILAPPVLVVGLAAAILAGPGLLLRATSGGDGARPVYYATAIRMFESSPIVGTGPGTWAPQRIAYTQPGETDYYVPHAHNIYLQTLAEFGLVGVAAGLLVAVALGRLLLGAVRDPNVARRRMGWAALFATVFFGAIQLLDSYANSPAILFAFAIPIAWLDATAPPRAVAALHRLRLPSPGLGRRAAAGRIAGLAGIAVILASATYLAWSERGAVLMSEGTDLANDSRDSEALGPLTEAVRLDNAMPPYHFALGLVLANTGDLGAAERELATSAAADGLPEAWLDLAAVRVRLGQVGPANEALAQALRLGVQQAGVVMGAGAVNLELGQVDGAVSTFAQALLLSPTLAGDPWWTADPARAAIWPRIYELAFSEAPAGTRFVMALETGDLTGAATAITAMDDAELQTTSTLVMRAWTGDADALAQLQTRARQRPLDQTVVNWCALLLRRSGADDAAASYSVWAATVNALSTSDGYEVRVTSDPNAAPAGISTLFYGQYTYRRPVPGHQLVNWLPALGYE